MKTATRETNRTAARLSRGFDQLTLNPAPRLRHLRGQIQRDQVRHAWTLVGVAMVDAIRSVGQIVTPRTR